MARLAALLPRGLQRLHKARRFSKRPWGESAATPAAAAFFVLLLVLSAAVTLLAGPDVRMGGGAAVDVLERGEKARVAAPLLLGVEAREEAQGVSLVAACKGRHEALKESLPSWLALRHVNEVVIVDWSSEPPLEALVRGITKNPRVKVVRVEGEGEWVLSRAYNLAVSVAARKEIVRTDCDYVLDSGFVKAHNLDGEEGAIRKGTEEGLFYAGDWGKARNENEVHLNGAVFIHRKDFLGIGGYDERIQTYGWDDSDLYERLKKRGVVRKTVSYNHIAHVKHGEEGRAQKTVKFSAVETDFNHLLLSHLKPWTRRMALKTQTKWAVVSAGTPSNFVQVRAVAKPRALRQLVDPATTKKEWNLALARRLHDDHKLPWELAASMDAAAKETLLRRLMAGALKRADAKYPKVLFAHVMHGLGNRLRALASAMAFAKESGRVLVLIWEVDAHISANFDDLFVPGEMPVIRSFRPKWAASGQGFDAMLKWDKTWANLHTANYVDTDGGGAVKDAYIADRPDMHIYFKSSSVMNAPNVLTSWEKANVQLRSLVPVKMVRDAVATHEKTSDLSKRIGMHIRDRTLKRDIENVNFKTEYGSAASDTMDYWRKQSSRKTFIAEIRRLVAANHEATFYIASDTYTVISELDKLFPGRIIATERDCDGRDERCVRFALIDVLCLAKVQKLYGSNWSSFTEVAQRFGGPKALLAGQDFGVAEADDDDAEARTGAGAEVASGASL